MILGQLQDQSFNCLLTQTLTPANRANTFWLMQDIAEAGLTLHRLLQNTTAYEEMIAWKNKGPQDSFIALVDINAVSSNCRLCIKVKTSLAQHELP